MNSANTIQLLSRDVFLIILLDGENLRSVSFEQWKKESFEGSVNKGCSLIITDRNTLNLIEFEIRCFSQ